MVSRAGEFMSSEKGCGFYFALVVCKLPFIQIAHCSTAHSVLKRKNRQFCLNQSLRKYKNMCDTIEKK